MYALAPWDTVTVARGRKRFTIAPVMSFKPHRKPNGFGLLCYEELDENGLVAREWNLGLGGNCEPPTISDRIWKEAARLYGGINRPVKVCPDYGD